MGNPNGENTMARMHARKRGQSGSKRPYVTEPPDWIPLSIREIQELIVQMSKEGMSTALIGTRLRDQYGIPSVKLVTKKSISEILAEEGIKPELPEDLQNLMKKAVQLNTHLTSNKGDKHNRRGLELTEAKIRRLVRYYKSKGILPQDWKYSLDTAKLQIE